MTNIYPTLDQFKHLANKGNIIPLYKEIIADEYTPVSLFERLAISEPYSYLLESLEGGEHWARYSFLSFDPANIITVENGMFTVRSKSKIVMQEKTIDPIASLQRYLFSYKPVHLANLPRFWGGVVGYIGYDTVKYYEQINEIKKESLDLPEMLFMQSSKLLIFDHLKHKLMITVAVNVEGKKSKLNELYKQGSAEIERIEKKIKLNKTIKIVTNKRAQKVVINSNVTHDEFVKSVERAQEYINAGDCIQIVMSQRFHSKVNAHPFNIYRALRVVNPSPYLYYFNCGNFFVVGSSPEILVRKEGTSIETRPIAGTRPRGKTEKEDALMERELLQDEKELAEHLMLVDLGRNDLGKVAKVGSVTVPEFKVVERYSHVMHIVSQVQAQAKPGATAKDVLISCFPAGTVSGAPKVRAMQIIEELERTGRGPYAGALGYLSYEGNMDMAITIRTIIVKDSIAYVQAGAGIVADSVPENEYKETQNKARALFKAIELAQDGSL